MNKKILATLAICLVGGGIIFSQATEKKDLPCTKTVEKISAEKNIPLVQILTKESLGQCLGKDFRAVAAILDEGFTKSIEKLLSSAKE